jgi:hypothetical protein
MESPAPPVRGGAGDMRSELGARRLRQQARPMTDVWPG